MILGDLSLWKLLNDLIRDPDPDLVSSASIHVRVGPEMRLEVGPEDWRAVDLAAGPVHLQPGDFALVPTLEWLMVPNGYAVELKLGSAYARQGYEQAAVWLDPGWSGTATLGIRNATRHTPLPIEQGMRLAQIIVHQLDQPAVRLYRARDEGLRTIERPQVARGTDRSPR
jgi:deoxycytidine triphosphate deaminase